MTAPALCAECAHDFSLHVENGCLTCDCKALESSRAAAHTPEQCPAVNDDGMEGQQCHGNRWHRELHWIEFDDGVSEWGDNDELWDEVDRLRLVIENAPHDDRCPSAQNEPGMHFTDECTCWKAEAL